VEPNNGSLSSFLNIYIPPLGKVEPNNGSLSSFFKYIYFGSLSSFLNIYFPPFPKVDKIETY
jgi:hypothetical protein